MKRDQPLFPPRLQSNVDNANRLVVLSDLADFKFELVSAFKVLLKEILGQPSKRWLKTSEVRKMLGMSAGTLQTLRNKGTIPSTKIGGVVYYDIEEIKKVLSSYKSKGNG
ncbi:helix-turn-helix domain-containing protein [Niabella sp. CC-SYL272]|uniref:helix-turn-helix domain-containing protein n=1 Tax=Niabella agricola TaxID=2891571 RepID=UPI001F33BFE9|nr:helix-turn-helix domain-containing protein [Niabella agricola]MCF3109634.1 helix-turn-helix domain-containing protein [Niabella agricola]